MVGVLRRMSREKLCATCGHPESAHTEWVPDEPFCWRCLRGEPSRAPEGEASGGPQTESSLGARFDSASTSPVEPSCGKATSATAAPTFYAYRFGTGWWKYRMARILGVRAWEPVHAAESAGYQGA